jgi:NTE family protein
MSRESAACEQKLPLLVGLPMSQARARGAQRSRRPWLGVTLAALLAHGGAGAAPTTATTPGRPKVCLVLSGGGARAAHVGVLKVLEQLRVPVDCITGTSMGSIVGGAYASGTPLDEMEATLASMSTRQLFKELPPREERATRLKQDDVTNLAPVELGLRDGELVLPRGVVSGVQLETVLRQLSKVRGFRRFDELPIPFRAIATDLVTGKPVVLSQGDLPGAMRASMSVPAAIDPVQIEGQLLVDGGLTNNLPVDVARAMGADVVIAVNLGTPLMRPENPTSILGVTSQMVNILTEQNVRASLAILKPTDILVRPQLAIFSDRLRSMVETVPIGEAATRSSPTCWLGSPSHRRVRGLADATSVRQPGADRAGRRIRFAPLAHVNPEVARRDADPARRADRSAGARSGHEPPVRHRRLRPRELSAARGARPPHPGGRCGREIVGPNYLRLGPACRRTSAAILSSTCWRAFG